MDFLAAKHRPSHEAVPNLGDQYYEFLCKPVNKPSNSIFKTNRLTAGHIICRKDSIYFHICSRPHSWSGFMSFPLACYPYWAGFFPELGVMDIHFVQRESFTQNRIVHLISNYTMAFCLDTSHCGISIRVRVHYKHISDPLDMNPTLHGIMKIGS